jgi:hypothetical protein
MRRAEPTLLSDERGAAYVEFLLAFVPLFLFFVGMIQMAVLYAASLLVEHAADRAARAAATMLDDDPRYYLGEARGDLTGAELEPFGLRALYARHALRPEGVGVIPLSRRAAITAVAAMPLLVLVPRPPGGDLSLVATDLFRRLELTAHAPDAWDTGAELARVEGAEVEIRIRFRYACAIPVGGRLVCGPQAEHVLTASARRAVHRADYPYLGPEGP